MFPLFPLFLLSAMILVSSLFSIRFFLRIVVIPVISSILYRSAVMLVCVPKHVFESHPKCFGPTKGLTDCTHSLVEA